ncbi:MAG: PilZ domain-containing protein [Planctomycetota bacterium]
MSLHPHNASVDSHGDDLIAALGDLEQAVSEGSRRESNRSKLNCAVRLLPGNVSDREIKKAVSGTCKDISPGGCRLVLKSSLIVGDIFLLQVEDKIGMDPAFVRCVRCHMLREDSFDCGLEFLSPLQLPTNANKDDSLLNL